MPSQPSDDFVKINERFNEEHWILQRKGLYFDKEKILNFLTNSRHPADVAFGFPTMSVQQEDSKFSSSILNDAAKVVQNFQNPPVEGENFQNKNSNT